ncbi:hypothetical protein [Sphingosinithalassobacter sp. LHW66-3]|uniref:hypothetical protein n=1 Tax=Sphingosinithalassobacter sp. LHW66-3 TaxID=3424718 RepID=UPI003D6BFDB8
MAPSAPLWLAEPSRFARLRSGQARIAAVLLLILLAAGLGTLAVPEPPQISTATGHQQAETDLALYEKIVAGVRYGGSGYYSVAADAMRAGGYPLQPFFTVRLPGLAVVQSALPERWTYALLFLLAGATAFVWMQRLSEALPRTLPRIGAGILLLGSMLAFVQPGLAAFHEIWAALFVALSIALRRPGRWVEAVALGLIAMLIRETAALYVIVMAGLAWTDGERRETAGWGAALLIFALVMAAHAYAVAGVTGPLDAASPGWLGLEGLGLFVKAAILSTALQLLPLWLASLLVCLALFGWLAWDNPLGLRMAVTLGAYAMLIALFARLDTFYWGLMVAPVLLVGLAFAPDGLRDLWRQMLDRRIVRVQRITR